MNSFFKDRIFWLKNPFTQIVQFTRNLYLKQKISLKIASLCLNFICETTSSIITPPIALSGVDWSDQPPAGGALHRALLLPLHRGERLGEGGGGGPPALQGPPGQQPHRVLGQEQGLRHPLHWRGHHHPRQEDGRYQDHQ